MDAANALHGHHGHGHKAGHEDRAKVDLKIKLKKFLDMTGPGYYCYDGSLTTPTCNEVVSWFVMEKAITISQEQV